MSFHGSGAGVEAVSSGGVGSGGVAALAALAALAAFAHPRALASSIASNQPVPISHRHSVHIVSGRHYYPVASVVIGSPIRCVHPWGQFIHGISRRGDIAYHVTPRRTTPHHVTPRHTT